MKHKRRKPFVKNANMRLPESVTTEITQELLNLLGTDPKESYLRQELLSKYVGPDTDPAPVRRTRAIFKWLCTEMNNEATNVRLVITPEEYQILPRVTYLSFMDKLRSVVIDMIGEVPPIESLLGSFSGGASTSRPRTSSQPARKFLGKADVTARALPWFELALEEMPGWQVHLDYEYNIVPGNVLFTVPKKTDIDRCACKEPDINMYLQKGVGSYLRSCLRRKGLNLNDQSINRRLAKIGSRDGSLATLDLSSASDSVSRELVFQALPPLWYSLMDAIRSPVTIIDGEEHVNEMFSSMGNGFTFELESLLFYSIARTTAYFRGVSGVIGTYGDDLIVPSVLAEDLIFVLEHLGFEVNSKKSFWTGPFRESCGGHYHLGHDITPFYLKGPILRITDLIRFLNQLRKWCVIDGLGVLDPTFGPLWLKWKQCVPRRFWGGRDYNSIAQLVSPEYPWHRLIPIQKKRQTGLGGYLHWLNSTWYRSTLSGEVITSEESSTTDIYRSRPAAKADVTRISTLFLEELMTEDRCVR